MAGMMNFNPAGYSIPLQQQSPFAPGREATPQQAHPYPQQQQQQFYSNQQVAATYAQPQFSPPAHYPQQSFGGGTVPVHANGAAAYGGGINVQPGFQNQYPASSLPTYSNSPYAPQAISAGGGIPTTYAPSPLATTSGAMAAPSQPSPMNPLGLQQQQLLLQQQQQQQQQQVQRPMSQINPVQQQQPQMGGQRSLSPTSAAREKSRVSTLLEINSALLQEVVSLQSQGKAGIPAQPPGHTSPTQGTPTDPAAPSPTTSTPTIETPTESAGKPAPKTPSKEYIDCMRRLQANLAYLATIADRAKKPGAPAPPAPAIMDPPPHMQSMAELYGKLVELFPDAQKGGRMSQQQMAQQRAQLQGQKQNAGMMMPSAA